MEVKCKANYPEDWILRYIRPYICMSSMFNSCAVSWQAFLPAALLWSRTSSVCTIASPCTSELTNPSWKSRHPTMIGEGGYGLHDDGVLGPVWPCAIVLPNSLVELIETGDREEEEEEEDDDDEDAFDFDDFSESHGSNNYHLEG